MIEKIGTDNQREFFRIDGELFLHVEALRAGAPGPVADVQGFFIPSFSQQEDDIVGLSIDAFREHVLLSEIPAAQKDFWLRVQQMLALMKRTFEAELQGKKPKTFARSKVNISGSGVAFLSAESHLVGQILRLSLFFPRFPYSYLGVQAEVAKCEKKTNGYWVRTRFKDIGEKAQDEILRFVNQCQRDSRQK